MHGSSLEHCWRLQFPLNSAGQDVMETADWKCDQVYVKNAAPVITLPRYFWPEAYFTSELPPEHAYHVPINVLVIHFVY